MSGHYHFLHSSSLKAKRVAIKLYIRKESGHHCFQLESGKVYEGYIEEVKKDTIVFSWAYSPMTPDADLSSFELPIEQITALIT
jgi:hypothetical protein